MEDKLWGGRVKEGSRRMYAYVRFNVLLAAIGCFGYSAARREQEIVVVRIEQKKYILHAHGSPRLTVFANVSYGNN